MYRSESEVEFVCLDAIEAPLSRCMEGRFQGAYAFKTGSEKFFFRFGMIIVGASCPVLAFPEVQAACVDPPGNDQVTVWTDPGFTGPCTMLGHGVWNTLPDGFDDNIESLKVGLWVRLVGYRETNRNGDYTIWESGSYCSNCSMKLGAVGDATNNSLSSASVSWAGPHRMSYTFLSDMLSKYLSVSVSL
jgi:hypothetical protein